MKKELEDKLCERYDNMVGNNEEEHKEPQTAEDRKELFLKGGRMLLELLWHESNEEPQAGRELIVKSSRGTKVYPNHLNTKMSWQCFVRITRVLEWAYSDELSLEDTVQNAGSPT